MKPLFFPGQNRVLTGPKGILDDEIIPLPVLASGGLVMSVWELDADERAAIAAGAPIAIAILSGETQPPVCPVVLNAEDGLSRVAEAHAELLLGLLRQ